jgi:hypothetical protein
MKQPANNSAPSKRRREPGTFRFSEWLGGEIAALNPGYFALVMATGIISNAMFFTGHRAVSNVLFAANIVFLPWLIAATLWRALHHRRGARCVRRRPDPAREGRNRRLHLVHGLRAVVRAALFQLRRARGPQ